MTQNQKNASTVEGSAASRMKSAFDLMETSIEMMRQNIRRRSPSLSDSEVLVELQRWIEQSDATVVMREYP